MVVHETYRDADGHWVAPAEVRIEGEGGGRARSTLDGDAPIEIGPIEKMSKSKRNTVDPDEIIGTYGADTARWFMLSDSPPERDVIWTEAGVQGAYKQTQRLWRLTCEIERSRRRDAAGQARRLRRGRAGRPPRSPMARSPRSRTRSSGCASTSASRRSTNSPTRSAPPSARSTARPVADDLRYAFAEAGDMLVARLRADDAASRRGMLGGARPRRDSSPGRRGRRSTAA